MRDTRGDFEELCLFARLQQCEPEEAAAITVGMIHFPTFTVRVSEEGPRLLYLCEAAAAILHRQARRYNCGPVFRDAAGNAFQFAPSVLSRFAGVKPSEN